MSLLESFKVINQYLNSQSYFRKNKCLVDNSLEGMFDQSSLAWKNQYYRNEVHLQVIKDFITKYNFQEEVVVLKGVALLDLNIYENFGQRLTGDIDILVENFELIETALIKENFLLIEAKSWKGNCFKKVYQKNYFGIDVAIEIHQKLFYHTDFNEYKYEYSSSGLKILSKEWMLLHLVGHLAFQHTFLKVHWLIEIEIFIRKYEKELNWDYFYFLITKFKFKRSWELTRVFCNLVIYDSRPNSLMLRWLCTLEFILFPEEHKIRYYLIKMLTKDSIFTFLDYSIHWILNLGWKK